MGVFYSRENFEQGFIEKPYYYRSYEKVDRRMDVTDFKND